MEAGRGQQGVGNPGYGSSEPYRPEVASGKAGGHIARRHGGRFRRPEAQQVLGTGEHGRLSLPLL